MSFLNDLTSVDIALLLDIVDSTSTSYSSETEEAEVVQPQASRRLRQGSEYRRRKREECGALRREVDTLEKVLGSLQSERSPSAGRIQSLVPAISSVWRRMATQQLTARKHSELENARLKKALERQLKLAQQLQRLLQKQANKPHTAIASPAASVYFGYDSSLSSMDWTTDAGCAQVDAVFAEVGLYETTRDFEDVSVHPGAGDAPPYIQVRHVRVFPFDKTMVQQSGWEPPSVVPLLRAAYTIKVWTSELIVVQYETPAQIGLVEITLLAELTVHRIHAASRTVNRFALLYAVRSDHSAYDGVQMLGEGWYTIGDNVCADASVNSIVHCVERTTLQGSQQPDLSLLCGIVSKQYGAHFNRLENTLMDKVIGHRSTLSQ